MSIGFGIQSLQLTPVLLFLRHSMSTQIWTIDKQPFYVYAFFICINCQV